MTRIIEGINDLSKKTKCCILGVRNDGKAEDHSQIHKSKGSSALEDIARLTLRAIIVHPHSSLGNELNPEREAKEKEEEKKKIESKKGLVITAQFGSSVMKPKAKMYSIEVTEFNDVQNNIVKIPIACFKRDIKPWEMSRIEFLCSQESGRSVKAQIRALLVKYKSLELKEIKSHLAHLKPKAIENAISRNPDLFENKNGFISLKD